MRNGRAGAVRSAILAAQAAAFTSRLLVSYWPLARFLNASPEAARGVFHAHPHAIPARDG